ncbi:MAG: PLD nuclease N-terminal domain-containing protein [Flavobacteriales bacterium]|nr:PLD nuclease N-terminal domain-containing protein [Flavobacteriales bacterium]
MKQISAFIVVIFLTIGQFTIAQNKEYEQIPYEDFEAAYSITDIESIKIIDDYDIRCSVKNKAIPFRFFRSDFKTEGDYQAFLKEVRSNQVTFSVQKAANFGEFMASWGILFLSLILYILLLSFAILKLTKKKFEENINKIVWLVIILIMPILGSFLFIFWGSKQK